MPTMNLEKIYRLATSLYRSFNFQQHFFYDNFLRKHILRVIGCQSIHLYETTALEGNALSKHLRATEGQMQMFSLLTEVD